MATTDRIDVARTYYLDTSAVSALVRPTNRRLQQTCLRLVRNKILVVTSSTVALEEILGTKNEQKRMAIMDLLRSLAPAGFSGDVAPIVRQMVNAGAKGQRCIAKLVPWNSVPPRVIPASLEVKIAAFKKRFVDSCRELMAHLEATGYPGARSRPDREWHDAEKLCGEVSYLMRYRLFRDRKAYADFFMNRSEDAMVGVTEEQAWKGRRNPWVQLYLRLVVLVAAKCLLRRTDPTTLTNDHYDALHALHASTTDVLVTEDGRFRTALRILGRGTAAACSLQDWASEVEELSTLLQSP